MGKMKALLLTMEEEAAELSKLQFCLKHGAIHQDIWHRIEEEKKKIDDGMREPEETA